MRLCLAALALVGCGRLDFDDRPIDATLADAPRPACPDGYVFVRGDATLATTDFCAMKYEARARDENDAIVEEGCVVVAVTDCEPNGLVVSRFRAESVPAGKPWRGIDALGAFAACQRLGAGYTLMTNPEWMTIARAAEGTGANWSGGAPYAGRLVEGNSEGTPILGVTNPTDPYSDTGNSAADPPDAGWEQRRTIQLPSGAELWDMPAHLQEWIDWTYDASDYVGAPACSGGELTTISCTGYTRDDYDSASGTLDSFDGVGLVLGGAGNTARRGGQVSDRSGRIAGIYSLNMNRFADQTFPATGFRCVYRLP